MARFFRLYRSLQPEVQNLPVCGNARSGKFSKKYCVLRSFLKNYCGCRSFLELPDLQKPVERFPRSGKFLFFYGRFCTSACNIENFYKIYKFCASVVFHGLFLVFNKSLPILYKRDCDHHKLISIKNGVDIKKTLLLFKDNRSL